jgi:hypothetical protein
VIRLRSAFAAAAAACLMLSAPAPAPAQDADPSVTSAARQIGFEGVQAYEAGRYEEALDKLQRAYDLVKVPTFGLWSARSLVKLGRLVAASERYLEVTRIQLAPDARDIQKKAQADARTELDALKPRIPSVTIAVAGAPNASVRVTMDGKQVPNALLGVKAPVDPGKHVIEARVGERVEQREVTVAEGASETVRIDLPAAAGATGPAPGATATTAPTSTAPAPSAARGGASPAFTIAAVAIGGGGLALGAITGALAVGKRSDLEDSGDCRDDQCLPAAHDEVDSLDVLRLVSTIGFIVGGAGIATGITLLVVGGGGNSAPTATLRVTPGGGAVRGSF